MPSNVTFLPVSVSGISMKNKTPFLLSELVYFYCIIKKNPVERKISEYNLWKIEFLYLEICQLSVR